LLPRPRVNDNIFLGLLSGSDGEYCTWLSKNKSAPLQGASSYKRFDAGSFQGTFVNPSLYSALGARWRPNTPTSNQFVHAGLSAAIRSQAFNFSPTQQADLNLPVLSLSSRIECDGISYLPLSADNRKTSPYCVLYSDGDVEWRTASEARSEHHTAQQLARLLSISSHDSLVGMLGLCVACGYQEVVKAYNEAVKLIIHPDKSGMPGTDVAFMNLQPAYTDWNTARARQGWSHPAAPSSAPVNSDSPGPATAPGSAPQPQSHGPTQGTSTASDNNNVSLCIIAEDNNTFHNWDAGLQFLSDKEISGKLFELRGFAFTCVLPAGKDRTKFSNCMKKVLVLADIFQDSIRARDTLWHLARSLPTLLLSDGFKTIQTRCNRLLKGDLEWLWASCTKLGRARQTRFAANPHTGKAHTTTQFDALTQKLSRAGNFSKSCQAVCSDSTPSLGPHTLAKLQAKNPQGSVDFVKKIGPPPRIWMLYARKMIGGVSPKNAFLLTTYANIIPVLPP